MNRKTAKIVTFGSLLVLGLVLPAGTRAQFRDPADFVNQVRKFLFVDYAYFQSSEDPSLDRLEIYYQVFNRGLVFEKTGNQHTANYEISITIDDDDDNRIKSESRDKSVVVADKDQANSRSDFRSSLFSYDLPPGEYKIAVLLTDQGNKDEYREEFKVKMRELDRKQPTLSEVLFSQGFRSARDRATIFDKGSLSVIPSVTRRFGGEDDASLAYYFEVYAGNDDSQKVVVETRIRHQSKGMVYRDTLHVQLTKRTEREMREVSLESFPAGDYTLELSLRDRRNKKLDERKFEFSVAQSQDAMIRADWKNTVNQLKLLDNPATDGFDKIESPEERLKAYQQFWQDHDPTPGTPENEAKREFYRRIAVANNSFSGLRRAGWKTDRGRTYIIYGAPDQIDDEPFLPNSLPFQIWHYYSQGPYRRFLFVDENNDGDYRLQYPYDGLY